MGQKQFDPIKASFYLIALIIGVHCFVVLVGVAACIYEINEIVAGKWKCDPEGRLSELLAAALATALAFGGGFSRNPPNEPPPPTRRPD